MAESLEGKMVVAVSSTALFDLSEAAAIFRERGVAEYRAFQRSQEQVPLRPGAAYPLVRRLLDVNAAFRSDDVPVEVVLLSRNDPDTGLRVLHSIEHHRLPMRRAIFASGRNPYRYARALDACLFLSTNLDDVRAALASGVPAGHLYSATAEDDERDGELRIAFDFDGVLADDESEQHFQQYGLAAFHQAEQRRAGEPLRAGPMARFCRELGRLQSLLARAPGCRMDGVPSIRTVIVTSRGAPAHTRVVNTLRGWGIAIDEAFFLSGLPKRAVLAELRPHIFFDDQRRHLEDVAEAAPCVHVPFGVSNEIVASTRPSVDWLH